ncbi:auxin efflux carrier [Lentinula edodes]|uniref:Auxin efflux carrier n=1 Tax=Lentinula edodes TaxID=5353 RepID=A0A1Q3EMZ4_LENED|nr:auxin efflux carrier [Lentinula edodes]
MIATNSAGFLIYEGVMPLLKTYIAIFIGYIVARTGLFPPAASRSSSQLTMNVALPCLIFSNIVPAFTPSNISAIGPLMLLAVIYILVGFASGLIIREICFVPRNFWQGIIIAAGMSNWGNLPTSVVQSVTAHAPFNGTTDVELGVSFVSIFIMVYHIFFWVFGAAASLQWDFLPDVPQGEEAMRRVKWNEKPIGGFLYRWLYQQTQEEERRLKSAAFFGKMKGFIGNKENLGSKSLIQPLKALFTDATASGGPDWTGPDGSPPLNFIMDTATFVGGLCIPLSLIILGASFARMSIPKRLSTLPIPAMIMVTLSKEVLVPVVGIFLTQTFVNKGLIPKDNLAQRFVAIFLSGTPTAVKKLVVANLYAPEGGMDTLTAFLVVEYTFMFISSTALTAVALLLL